MNWTHEKLKAFFWNIFSSIYFFQSASIIFLSFKTMDSKWMSQTYKLYRGFFPLSMEVFSQIFKSCFVQVFTQNIELNYESLNTS